MSISNISKSEGGQQQRFSLQRDSDASALRQLIMGFRNTQLIAVAAKLRLADHLKGTSKTAEQLAEIVHTNSRVLYRLLRALTSLGIFEEQRNGEFSLTPLAGLLLEDSPGSLRRLAILYGEEWLWRAYAGLLYSVESGRPAFDHVHGKSLYEYLQQHPEASTTFNEAMTGYSDTESEAIISGYDFSMARTVIDVGGGQGALLSALVRRNPHLSGIVYDLSAVIEKIADDTIRSAKGLKISYVPGNFFIDVPGNGDIYILKSVLHNWDDASCIQILRNCRKAIDGDSRLLVLERLIPTKNQGTESILFDINMLVMTGGQERTEEEYGNIFREAGFFLTRIIPTSSSISIIEGLPISQVTKS